MSANDMADILQLLLDSGENLTHFDEHWTQGRSALGIMSCVSVKLV